MSPADWKGYTRIGFKTWGWSSWRRIADQQLRRFRARVASAGAENNNRDQSTWLVPKVNLTVSLLLLCCRTYSSVLVHRKFARMILKANILVAFPESGDAVVELDVGVAATQFAHF